MITEEVGVGNARTNRYRNPAFKLMEPSSDSMVKKGQRVLASLAIISLKHWLVSLNPIISTQCELFRPISHTYLPTFSAPGGYPVPPTGHTLCGPSLPQVSPCHPSLLTRLPLPACSYLLSFTAHFPITHSACSLIYAFSLYLCLCLLLSPSVLHTHTLFSVARSLSCLLSVSLSNSLSSLHHPTPFPIPVHFLYSGTLVSPSPL